MPKDVIALMFEVKALIFCSLRGLSSSEVGVAGFLSVRSERVGGGFEVAKETLLDAQSLLSGDSTDVMKFLGSSSTGSSSAGLLGLDRASATTLDFPSM